MSKKLIGMLAGVALFGSGAAFAGDDQHKKDQQAQQQPSDTPDTMGTASDLPADQSAIGGSGQEGEDAQSTTGTAEDTQALGTGGSGAQADSKELTGKVVWAEGQKVYVDHMGAVVELRTDSQTQFSGEATRVKDLKEGDEIRASFSVDKGIRNKALSIEKTSATGGSGFEDVGSSTEGGLDNTGATEPAEGALEEGALETPPADSTLPGTGGAGTEGTGSTEEVPDTMGTEPTESLPEQTGSESEVDSSATDSSTQIQ